MRFSAALAAVLPVGAALAQQVHQVAVGDNNGLVFNPTQLSNIAVGDSIQFVFTSKNHTVTQSSFAAPCTELQPTDGSAPIDSDFQFVASGTTAGFPAFTVNVTGTTPLWFYCRQKTPVNHCQMGMVFAVNPTADKTFDQFQANAKNTVNATSTDTSSGAAPASTDASSAAPASTDATSTAGATDTASVTSSSTSTSASSTTTNAAGTLRAGAAGVLLGGVAVVALVL